MTTSGLEANGETWAKPNGFKSGGLDSGSLSFFNPPASPPPPFTPSRSVHVVLGGLPHCCCPISKEKNQSITNSLVLMFQVVNWRAGPYARHQGKQVNSIDPDSDSLSHAHKHTCTHIQPLSSETWNALEAFCIAPKLQMGS